MQSRTRADLQRYLHQHGTALPPESWSLDALTLAAFYYNPELEAARALGADLTVNADDPDGVIHVARMAFEFQRTFKHDVVIDLVCHDHRRR